MNNLHDVAYRIDPALELLNWQEQFLRAPQGASILALTARQGGKTSTAAWAIANAVQRGRLPGATSER